MPSTSVHVPLKAIIFDIGRVIVRLKISRGIELLALNSNRVGTNSMQSAEEMWTLMRSDERRLDWQEGRITPEAWYKHVIRILHIRPSFEEFCAAWNRVLELELILPEALFAELSSRFRLGLLSNTDPIHVAFLEVHFSFLRHFPVRIYSNQIGVSKPSPRIYQVAVNALGVNTAEALYIDDIAEYADTARGIGMDAIHFEDPEQLLRELSHRGIASNSAYG